jgi:hypothetical protein
MGDADNFQSPQALRPLLEPHVTPCYTAFLEQLILIYEVEKFPTLEKPEDLSLCSQNPTMNPVLKPL